MTCQALFAGQEKSEDKARLIDERMPNCACEANPVSLHSPGPVADGEQLCRLILSPVHLDPATGAVKELAFDDASNKGLSVIRLEHAGGAQGIRDRGEAKAVADRAKGKDRQFNCALWARAGEVRALRFAPVQGRRFCIYDTAYPEDSAHADIFQTRGGSKVERAQLRRELQKRFAALRLPSRP